jgi:arylsulfatase A-like enzyme
MSLTRRSFSALLPLAPMALVKAAPAKRNVLFIAIDDLNDWIGCLRGHPNTITPNLDRLASRSVNFTSAHCAAPLCNPARSALMTGRRPSSTGVYLNTQPYHGSKALASVVTLNQHFKDSGYLTLGCGKIYHNTQGAFADNKGWDDYGKVKESMTFAGEKPLAGEAVARAHFDWGPTTSGDEAMLDYQTTDWVSRHLQQKRDKPMFLACGFQRPHLPWYVPKKYFDMHPLDRIQLPVVKEDDLDDVPGIGKKFAISNGDHARVTKGDAWKKGVQGYLASITFADAMVGRVLRALETGPHAKDTMVVLWSDHGWHLGEKLHWRKFTLWERSTRNVLMFDVPGVAKPNTACDRVVSLMDIYPTLMELQEMKAPGPLEGESLVKWLKDPKAPKSTPAVTTYQFGNHAVRSARWRYIRYVDGTEELYDRDKDPNEWTNVAGRPELAPVKKELAQWLPRHNEPDAPRRAGDGEGQDE